MQRLEELAEDTEERYRNRVLHVLTLLLEDILSYVNIGYPLIPDNIDHFNMMNTIIENYIDLENNVERISYYSTVYNLLIPT